MIKLVATDLDGTLFNNLSQISPENQKAIRRLEENGITFTVASGRDRFSVLPALQQYGFSYEAILGNGSQYVDKNGTVLLSRYMDKSVFLKVIGLMNEYQLSYMIFTTDGFYTGCEPDMVREQFITRAARHFHRSEDEYLPGGSLAYMPCNHLIKVEDFQKFVSQDIEIIKVESFNIESPIVAAVQEHLRRIGGLAYLSSSDDNIEITDINAQKGLMLEKVARIKGLKHDEVMVLGDSMNDISLFQCFPDWSFAPANAVPELRTIAHQVVSSNMEDGFAEAVNLILDQQN